MSSILPQVLAPIQNQNSRIQLWTTAKERLSIPNPSATISSSSNAKSSGSFSGLLEKRQGAREGGGIGLSQQQDYCWSKGQWPKFPELQVGTTQVSELRYCVAEKSRLIFKERPWSVESTLPVTPNTAQGTLSLTQKVGNKHLTGTYWRYTDRPDFWWVNVRLIFWLYDGAKVKCIINYMG